MKSIMNFKKSTIFLQKYIRNISSQVASKPKNHYASLGITAKATQSDIKSAYYKLSMIYHPDKNHDSGAEEKFRDITEAYEILSNLATRKTYDRGLFMKRPNVPYEDIVVNKFYKSRDVRSKPPVPEGRTTVYNFDEWSRAHYQATFARDLRFKQKQEERRETFRKKVEESKAENATLYLGALLLLYFIFFMQPDSDTSAWTWTSNEKKRD